MYAATFYSRINTTFNHAYGMGGDLIIDAEFIDNQGNIFSMNNPNAPNLYSHSKDGSGSPYFLGFRPPRICSKMTVKLFPMTEDEEGFLIPFSNFQEAMSMARDFGRRRIGFAVGVISVDYLSFLLTLTSQSANELTEVFTEKLQIKYLLAVLGDKQLRDTIKARTDVYIDQTMADIIMRSVSKLNGNEGIQLISEIPTNKKPYELMLKEEMTPLLELTLAPSDEDITRHMDDDLKSFYSKVFSNPKMTNIVWLNMFRINSARIGRDHQYYPIILWASLNDLAILEEVCDNLATIGDKHGIKNGFGYSNTIDFAKWTVIEFDYYFDSDEEKDKVKDVCFEAYTMIDEYITEKKFHAVLSASSLFQGQCRTETLLYKK